MRIIAGKARGKKLKTPDGDHIRPTLDRIRENIYKVKEEKLSFNL